MTLAACANHNGVVPSSQSAMGPESISPPGLKTCAKSPPQYEWVFEGACQKFDVNSTGGNYNLGEYQGITVKGSLGKTTAKGTVKIALADALDKDGDIETYHGKTFPPFKGRGKTYFYATATNQSTQVIKPVVVRSMPVFQHTVTDANGFGDDNKCDDAILTFNTKGKASWDPLPTSGKVRGKTVTISQYAVPSGFELPPKTPIYFAVFCYKQ